MDIITAYRRLENESDDELIYRICKEKQLIGTWEDVKNILNELLNEDYGESTYRKKYQCFEKMFNANQKLFVQDNEILNNIQEQQRNLQKERMKLQTEKLEYNKWLRENARDELITEKICEVIKQLPLPAASEKIEIKHSNKTGILCFGDEHYGCEFEIKGLFGEVLNSYSPEIFEERMWKLQSEVIEIITKERLDSLHIFNLGDFSDGVLRVKQLFTLRYGIIEGSVLYGNFIVQWLNELSKYASIRFQMVFGNHTELRMLNQPKGTFEKENMGLVVKNMIKTMLADNPNFTFVENPTGLIYENIFGSVFLGIHGEVKDMNKALSDFSRTYNINISYLIAGHLHHNISEEVGMDKEVINVPSVIGIDDYSLSLNKTSNAGALLLVFEKDYGIRVKYPIKL